jgi:hypothetical protein
MTVSVRTTKFATCNNGIRARKEKQLAIGNILYRKRIFNVNPLSQMPYRDKI